MQKRIASVIPGGPGAVALAFMTGSQTALGRGEADDFRASGLAHMLSVSGLHFAIVAGILFFTVRFLLVALFPRFAVAHPVKKYAALVTLAGVALYLAIVGASVPAVRSVLMAGAGLLAIVADRNPFSMRIIALAALAILAFTPEALVTASFQMSFGAVAALVWFYERTRGVWSAATLRAGWLGRPLVYVLGICATTVVASLATAPFSLYHFQQLPLYGVLGNFLAAPVLSFIVMPAIIVAYLLMPFGWDAPALHLVGFGNGLILRIAHAVAQLPHAAWTPAAWPVAGFLCAVAAGLWLLLANGRWMWGALAPLAAAALIAASPVPDVLVAQDGKLVAVLGPDRLYLSSRVHDRTSARNWAQMAGRGAKPGARWDGRDSGAMRRICLPRRSEGAQDLLYPQAGGAGRGMSLGGNRDRPDAAARARLPGENAHRLLRAAGAGRLCALFPRGGNTHPDGERRSRRQAVGRCAAPAWVTARDFAYICGNGVK
jgi:competence protein ComEC